MGTNFIIKRNWNKNVFWQFYLTWWVFFPFSLSLSYCVSCVHIIKYLVNYFFHFFPFCFRLECFCTWTNSKGKMVGWIEYNRKKTWDTTQQCTQKYHQTSNGILAKHNKKATKIHRKTSTVQHTHLHFKWIATESIEIELKLKQRTKIEK